MKNLYLLPTEKPSRLWLSTRKENYLIFDKFPRGGVEYVEPKNIYITSDEEIKEGDVVKIPCGVGKVKELFWKFGNDNPSYIVEDIFIYKLRYGQKEGELQINSFRYGDVKKIILTTDHDLIKDGVQAIPDEFLEWFVNNSSCEEVEVELLEYGFDEVPICKYEIIIPKEIQKQHLIDMMKADEEIGLYEELKQEILEKAAEKFYPPKTTDLICSPKLVRDSFIAGAKWQQERMYSEEELFRFAKICFYKGFGKAENDDANCYTAFREEILSLFEQFKKK